MKLKWYKIVLMLIIALSTHRLWADSYGKITGVVVDAESGDPIAGANIFLENTTLGAASDLEGRFIISKVPAGTYTMVVSVIGYAETRIKDLNVPKDKTISINVEIKPEILSTKEVVVEARALKNTEAALLKNRQKALALSDAISAQAISQMGAGNAAEAMKQVTGASIVDGKYVFVRGMGDRYTSTQLNGSALPSADPYKRSGSIDLIPSAMIDNIVTVKSFTPDKPGSFSGGIVNVQTKDYPDRFLLKFSNSLSYNAQVNYAKNTIGYTGGSLDWLGFDDGTRALPKLLRNRNVYIPDIGSAGKDPQEAELLTEMTRSFNRQIAPTTKQFPINQSYSLSWGNQYQLFNRPLGVLASLNYKNNYSAYRNGLYRRWNQGVQGQNALTNVYDYKDTYSKRNVLLAGLFKINYQLTPNHQIGLNLMMNHDAVNEARYLEGIYTYDSDANRTHQTSVLSYKERALSSYQLQGQHLLKKLADLRIDWSATLGSSSEKQPDRRFFSSYYLDIDGVRTYGIKDNLPPKRYFRDLNENRKDFKADFTLPFKQWNDLTAHFKFGTFFAQKERSYSERLFTFTEHQGFNNYDGNPNHLLDNQNTGFLGYDTINIRGQQYLRPKWGVVVVETILPANNYDAQQNITANYAMIELPLYSKLRLIGGARLERTNMWLQTSDSTLDKGQIKTNDLLPSLNLIFNLKKNMNLRLAVSRTIARPTFREIGPFATYDFDDGGDAYIGNPHLERTFIKNYDLRWEWFSRPGEIYAVSAFYKDFSKPIERVFNAFGENTWKNVKKAEAYGLELEARKRLDVVYEGLKNFMLSTNLSLIRSKVQIAESELELIRQLRPEAQSTRPFQGQSPYLLNVSLSYENNKNGLSADLYYNIFGERLDRVSYGGTPDIYEKPAGLLNASFAWKFSSHFTFKVAANNLLNPAHTKYQRFKNNDYIYSQYRLGRSISMGLSYTY